MADPSGHSGEDRLESPQTAYYHAFDRASRALAAIPLETSSAIEATRVVHRLSEELTGRLAELPSRDCGSACSACCHFEVGLREPEAILLASTISSHPDRERILDSIRTASKTERPPLSPCPLLDESGRCSTYAARPLPCRGWSASSRDLCHAHLSDTSIEPAPLPTGYALHLGLGDALDDWSRRAGMVPGPQSLPDRLSRAGDN